MTESDINLFLTKLREYIGAIIRNESNDNVRDYLLEIEAKKDLFETMKEIFEV